MNQLTSLILRTFCSRTVRVISKSTAFFERKHFYCSHSLFTTTKSTEADEYKMNSEVKNDDSSATELKVPVAWGYIAAKRWGKTNGKPVLAVHGWQDNAGTFDRLAPLLPNDWNLVCVDLPGHGQSSHFPNGFVYFILDYINAVEEVTSFLKWDKFNYLGHSMGSAIGLLYSTIFPERVDCLVSLDLVKGLSIDSSNPLLQKELSRLVQERTRFHKERDRPAPIQPVNVAIKKIMGKQEGSLTEESVRILMKRGAEFLPDDMVRFTRDRRLMLPIAAVSTMSTEQYKKLVEFMKCNLLIIKAKQGPWYDKVELYEEFKNIYSKYCKTFKYVEVEGTHHVHLNNPERVVDYIIEFMK